MKRFLILLFAAAAISATAQTTLYLRTTGGDREVAFGDVERISFPLAGGVEILLQGGAAVTADASQFVSLRFNDRHPGTDGITDTADALWNICGTVFTSEAPYSVYTAAGVKVAGRTGGSYDLATPGSGVYIITTANNSLKISVP